LRYYTAIFVIFGGACLRILMFKTSKTQGRAKPHVPRYPSADLLAMLLEFFIPKSLLVTYKLYLVLPKLL